MPEPTAQDRVSLSRMIHTAYTIRVPCCLVSDHDLPSSVRLLIWSPFLARPPRLTSLSKLRRAASRSGELEAKRSTCLPGMQRGSRNGFTSQRHYDRWSLGGLSRREHPVAIR